MKDLIVDALLRIAFRPRWNYTRTIVNREFRGGRLWSEVSNYLTMRHLNRTILITAVLDKIKTFFNEMELDPVTLYPINDIPSKPGATDCYRRWDNFLYSVLNGINISLQDYISHSLVSLSNPERKILSAIIESLPCPEFSCAYQKWDFGPGEFYEKVQKIYNQKYNDELNANQYASAIIRSGLGDWALDYIEFFKNQHTEPNEFIINMIDFTQLLKSIDQTSTDDNIPQGTTEHVKETVIIRERIMVICPSCGHKNEYGSSKCYNCGAPL